MPTPGSLADEDYGNSTYSPGDTVISETTTPCLPPQLCWERKPCRPEHHRMPVQAAALRRIDRHTWPISDPSSSLREQYGRYARLRAM